MNQYEFFAVFREQIKTFPNLFLLICILNYFTQLWSRKGEALLKEQQLFNYRFTRVSCFVGWCLTFANDLWIFHRKVWEVGPFTCTYLNSLFFQCAGTVDIRP